MEAHRNGNESGKDARKAAEEAGKDKAAQDHAFKEAFKATDDRTPQELQTFEKARGLSAGETSNHGPPHTASGCPGQ